jgi:hypothetical protein
MSQISVRNIPEKLDKQLRKLSRKNHVSLNKTIILLLEKALGLNKDKDKVRRLSHLAGTWTQSEAKEFESHIQIFNKVDKEIWET